MKIKNYEKLCLYVQVFVAALMFSIFYENTKFTFGSVIDIHSQFEEWHIALLVIGIFILFTNRKNLELGLNNKQIFVGIFIFISFIFIIAGVFQYHILNVFT